MRKINLKHLIARGVDLGDWSHEETSLKTFTVTPKLYSHENRLLKRESNRPVLLEASISNWFYVYNIFLIVYLTNLSLLFLKVYNQVYAKNHRSYVHTCSCSKASTSAKRRIRRRSKHLQSKWTQSELNWGWLVFQTDGYLMNFAGTSTAINTCKNKKYVHFSGSDEDICFAIHLNKHCFDKMIFLNVAVFNPDLFYRLTRLFSVHYKAQTRENTNWFEPQSSSTRQDRSRNAIRWQ